MEEMVILWTVIGVVAGAICGAIASNRGRRPAVWLGIGFASGFLFSLIGAVVSIVVVAVMSRMAPCPRCGLGISEKAVACSHCGLFLLGGPYPGAYPAPYPAAYPAAAYPAPYPAAYPPAAYGAPAGYAPAGYAPAGYAPAGYAPAGYAPAGYGSPAAAAGSTPLVWSEDAPNQPPAPGGVKPPAS